VNTNQQPPAGKGADGLTDRDDAARRSRLRAVADAYFDALRTGDLAAVPWHDDVILRTPLAPGGADQPITGGENVRSFFQAIAPAITTVTIIATYFAEDLTGIASRADVHISEPPCVLRVVDRFDVDDAGSITAQENHFDPRPAVGS
jgi:hypothetical protein